MPVSFILMFIIIVWAIAWPILSYLYIKAEHGTPEQPLSGPIEIRSGHTRIGPRSYGDEIVVMFQIGDQKYIAKDREINDVIRRLKSTQMTVRTMNEVKALE